MTRPSALVKVHPWLIVKPGHIQGEVHDGGVKSIGMINRRLAEDQVPKVATTLCC